MEQKRNNTESPISVSISRMQIQLSRKVRKRRTERIAQSEAKLKRPFFFWEMTSDRREGIKIITKKNM